ncbi:FERM and PDZ domain-containing protein 2-like [Rhinatrema bivittatum]|uniref:FERM and PDZ domain-containing protein 2-like n=1 Tax=Rhinatrema bivittatum TaxID=194408 RepID=UPI00112A70D8|nr:FERM and PDZ domain-containing protein 2-like [Rhinatrema bivittatum]
MSDNVTVVAYINHHGETKSRQVSEEIAVLMVTQQLSEYGVLFHRVFPGKKTSGRGEIILGICTKGIIVYEVKDGCRIASMRFQWRETERLSSHRKKFTVESSFSGKKHSFMTDSAKTCKYLLGLCSALHTFHAQMNSKGLCHASSEENKPLKMEKRNFKCVAQHEQLSRIQRLCHSENVLNSTTLESICAGMMSQSCDAFSVGMNEDSREESNVCRCIYGFSLKLCRKESRRTDYALVPDS